MLDYIKNLLNNAPVEWKPLGEICTKTENIKWDKELGAFHYIDLSSVDINTHRIVPSIIINRDTAPSRAQQIEKENDVLFATTRPTQMRVCLIPSEYDGQICSTGYCVLRVNPQIVLPKYLYFAVSVENFKEYITQNLTLGNYPTISNERLKGYIIPIPPLHVQEEIARILDKFTELEHELEHELELRKKQYTYYRDHLLTFPEGKAEYKTLGEIAEYSNERINATSLSNDNYIGVENLLQDRKGKTTSNYVPKVGNVKAYRREDILIGNIRPYLKKIWHADNDGGASGDVLVIHTKDLTIHSRYLYYVLSTDEFFSYCMKDAKVGKMPRGDKKKILGYIVPIPPSEEQERIVAILDKFERLTNSITEGLPREIELRRKQYEYYRDQLLDFPSSNA